MPIVPTGRFDAPKGGERNDEQAHHYRRRRWRLDRMSWGARPGAAQGTDHRGPWPRWPRALPRALGREARADSLSGRWRNRHSRSGPAPSWRCPEAGNWVTVTQASWFASRWRRFVEAPTGTTALPRP